MNISASVKHGLLIVGHIAKYGDGGYVSVASIARHHGIGAMPIGKATQMLLRANIVKNRMGPKGGFKLLREANKISMLDIVEAIDGPLDQLIKIGPETTHEPFIVNMQTTCDSIIAKAKDTLSKTKISKMIKE
jgi:Rrf2 family protein